MDQLAAPDLCSMLAAVGIGGVAVESSGKVLHSWGRLQEILPPGTDSFAQNSLLSKQLAGALRAAEPFLVIALDPELSGCMAWLSPMSLSPGRSAALAVLLPDRPVAELARERDAIIDASSDGLFVCDARARILRVNPASARINNATPEQLIGRDYHEAAREGLVLLPSAALDALKNRAQVSLLQENRNGRKLISTATPVFADNGDLIRVVVSERDMTEFDRLQRELEEQQARGDRFRLQIRDLQHRQLVDTPLIARSPVMIRALDQAMKLSEVDSTVLLLGESGTGKELFADLIHNHSRRAGQPLIKLNCGAIPETLIEAELFGYRKGAFTGAVGNKPGLLEIADGGTLFLDEIAELPSASQTRLLRFMEDGRLTRLGSTESRQVDVRILAATHRDLQGMVATGEFRQDLYYRLSVIPLQIPPLRERRECLLPLIRTYIDLFAERIRTRKRLTGAALDVLSEYAFPGNVRELMNICERLVVMSETELIDIGDLPETVLAGRPAEVPSERAGWPSQMTMNQILASVERQVLLEAGRQARKQQDIAAGLGMSQPTVARKLHKYGIRHHFTQETARTP